VNEVLTNAYTTEVEDDVKIASEFIYQRIRELYPNLFNNNYERAN